MKNEKYEFYINFKKITPEIQLKKVIFSKDYEKSLLKSTAKKESDFSRNTTTWD